MSFGTNSTNVDAQQQAILLKEIHEQVHNNINAENEKYQKKANRGLKEHKSLKEGDLVWLHLRKDRFPT